MNESDDAIIRNMERQFRVSRLRRLGERFVAFIDAVADDVRINGIGTHDRPGLDYSGTMYENLAPPVKEDPRA